MRKIIHDPPREDAHGFSRGSCHIICKDSNIPVVARSTTNAYRHSKEWKIAHDTVQEILITAAKHSEANFIEDAFKK